MARTRAGHEGRSDSIVIDRPGSNSVTREVARKVSPSILDRIVFREPRRMGYGSVVISTIVGSKRGPFAGSATYANVASGVVRTRTTTSNWGMSQ